MAQLTDLQIGMTLHKAGFRGFPLTRGIAIVLAESGGNTTARNSTGNTPKSTDRGLWMINNFWHKEVSDACAYNALCASKAAFRISKRGVSFSAWAVTKGNPPPYRKFMPRASRATEELKEKGFSGIFVEGDAAGPESFDLTDLADVAIKNPLENLGRFFGAILNPTLWIRVVQVFGGSVLMGMGLYILFREQVPPGVKKLAGRKR